MEIRLRPILLILLLAAAAIAAAVIGLPRLGIGPLAFGTPATPTAPGGRNPDPGQPAHHLRRRKRDLGLAGRLPGRPGDLGAAVAQPHPHDPGDAHRRNEPRPGHRRRRLSRRQGPGRHRLRRVRRQARPGLPVAIKQGAPGDDLNVAVTAAIPHAIRNAWLIHAPGGAEQIDAIRKNWSWEQFQPLLQKEGTVWRSSCLTVSKP